MKGEELGGVVREIPLQSRTRRGGKSGLQRCLYLVSGRRAVYVGLRLTILYKTNPVR